MTLRLLICIFAATTALAQAPPPYLEDSGGTNSPPVNTRGPYTAET